MPLAVAAVAQRAQVARFVAPALLAGEDVIDLARVCPALDAAEAVTLQHPQAQSPPRPRRASTWSVLRAGLEVRAPRHRAHRQCSRHGSARIVKIPLREVAYSTNVEGGDLTSPG
jgi:hypothetical protein